MTVDEITLMLPAEEEFAPVRHLVLGGLAARLDLTVENLEDIQLALDNLLERKVGEPVQLTVAVEDGMLRATVGPFAISALDELEQDDSSLGLRRILETVCDSYELEERDGSRWVELTKRTG
jgi:hypothetical protein